MAHFPLRNFVISFGHVRKQTICIYTDGSGTGLLGVKVYRDRKGDRLWAQDMETMGGGCPSSALDSGYSTQQTTPMWECLCHWPGARPYFHFLTNVFDTFFKEILPNWWWVNVVWPQLSWKPDHVESSESAAGSGLLESVWDGEDPAVSRILSTHGSCPVLIAGIGTWGIWTWAFPIWKPKPGTAVSDC